MKEEQVKYNIVEGTGSDAELRKYKNCFDQNESEKDLDVLKWFHQDNLREENSILYAVEEQSQNIAAIYTYLPTIVKCFDRNVYALQSFDTLTDHRHRGKGLFITIATELAQREMKRGNEFVFGFPNENSLNGFVKKLGFTYFGEVPFLIKPLRISYFLKKMFRKNHVIEEDSNCPIKAEIEINFPDNAVLKKLEYFGEEYEKFWINVKQHISIGVNRNADYMNWRFVNKPHADYLRFGYYEGSDLKGIIVFTLKNKHSGKVGYVMELLYDVRNKKAGKELLRFSNRTFKNNKTDVILSWCYSHSFNYALYKNEGFYNFPEKIRPQKLGVIVKVLNSTFEKEILKIKNWYLSYSDSDTV